MDVRELKNQNQKVLDEGNVKIAIFMGWEKNPAYGWLRPGQKEHWGNDFRSDDYLQFHSCWNELMSVVEAIESWGYDSRICGHSSDSGNLCDFVDFENNEAACVSSFEYNKITTVWKAVIQFIDWHNNHVTDSNPSPSN